MNVLFLDIKGQQDQGIENYDLPIIQYQNESFYLLDGPSKINILVGPNNSGKSRFLRSFLNRQISVVSDELTSFLDINTHLNDFIKKYKENKALEDTLEYAKFYQPTEISDKKDAKTFIEFVKYLPLEKIRSALDTNEVDRLKQQYERFLNQPISSGYVKELKLYIPMLRGVRPLVEQNGSPRYHHDDYQVTTKHHYFKDGSGQIFTGQSLYKEVREMLLGTLLQREKIQDYQKFIGDCFFDSQEVTLIPKENTHVLDVKIGNDKEQPIYHLGDGLQTLLIISFAIFMNPKATILIEEPDMTLHPGMQRRLLEIIQGKIQSKTSIDFIGRVFFTTHSNHFLDMTNDFDDISIYKFKRLKSEEKSQEAIPKFSISKIPISDRDALIELGARPSSVFITNCTVWVEGITDKRLIRHYFDIWQKETFEKEGVKKIFEEDTHFSFVEYSGANITHWSFLEEDEAINERFLCGTCFIVTDRDCDEEVHKFLISNQDKDEDELRKLFEKSNPGKLTEKHLRLLKLSKTLGNRCHTLNCWEIENTVSLSALKDLLKVEYKIEDSKLPNKDDYKNVQLGKYLENLTRSNAFNSESGTIKNKPKFSDAIIRHTKSYKDLSKEAIDLCEKIYQFIKKENAE